MLCWVGKILDGDPTCERLRSDDRRAAFRGVEGLTMICLGNGGGLSVCLAIMKLPPFGFRFCLKYNASSTKVRPLPGEDCEYRRRRESAVLISASMTRKKSAFQSVVRGARIQQAHVAILSEEALLHR